MINKNLQQDKKLIQDIKANSRATQNSALKQLYQQYYSSIEAYVLSNQGNAQEAADIFQDSLVILYQHIREGQFKEKSSIKTYLFAIARNLWIKVLRERGQFEKHKTDLQNDQLQVQEEDYVVLELNEFYETNKILEELMNDLKEECRTLLIAFYYQKKSILELKKEFDLGSKQAVKNKKYRCLKYLFDLFKNRGIDKSKLI